MAKKSKGRKMLSEKTQVGCVTGLQVEEQFQVKGFPDEQTTVSSSGQQRAGWLVKRSPPPPVVLPSRDGPLEPRQENPWVNPHKTLCLWGPEVFPQYLPLSPLCGGHGVRRGKRQLDQFTKVSEKKVQVLGREFSEAFPPRCLGY